MIKIAKDTITEILKDAGVKQIFFDDSAFDRAKANPAVIVLANKEELQEKRRKVCIWTDTATGKRYLRSQRYERILPIEVNIFHRTEEQADEIARALLAGLPDGVDDGQGNWTPIMPSAIDWPPDQKERALAVVFIKFAGGIYRDQELAVYTKLTGGTITKE